MAGAYGYENCVTWQVKNDRIVCGVGGDGQANVNVLYNYRTIDATALAIIMDYVPEGGPVTVVAGLADAFLAILLG